MKVAMVTVTAMVQGFMDGSIARLSETVCGAGMVAATVLIASLARCGNARPYGLI